MKNLMCEGEILFFGRDFRADADGISSLSFMEFSELVMVKQLQLHWNSEVICWYALGPFHLLALRRCVRD